MHIVECEAIKASSWLAVSPEDVAALRKHFESTSKAGYGGSSKKVLPKSVLKLSFTTKTTLAELIILMIASK